MQPSPRTASSTLPVSSGGFTEPRKAGTLTYEVVTVAAMILLLVSLWVF